MRRPATTARRLAELEQRKPRLPVTVRRSIREAGEPMPQDEPGVLHIVRTIVDPSPAQCAH